MVRSAPRRLRLAYVHTGLRFNGVYHNGADYLPTALEDLSHVLGDHRTGEVIPFDPKTLDMLHALAANLRIYELAILSGYRTPQSNAAIGGASNSQHLLAKAADFYVPPERADEFAEAALSLCKGGIGLYPSRKFMHIDCGRSRCWTEDASKQ